MLIAIGICAFNRKRYNQHRWSESLFFFAIRTSRQTLFKSILLYCIVKGLSNFVGYYQQELNHKSQRNMRKKTCNFFLGSTFIWVISLIVQCRIL